VCSHFFHGPRLILHVSLNFSLLGSLLSVTLAVSTPFFNFSLLLLGDISTVFTSAFCTVLLVALFAAFVGLGLVAGANLALAVV